MAGKRGTTQRRKSTGSKIRLGKDIEDGAKPQRDRKYRFRDHENLEADDLRRVEFKTTLLKSVESSKYLEEYRKSDEEVSPLLIPSTLSARF
jgi:hypothetical protein